MVGSVEDEGSLAESRKFETPSFYLQPGRNLQMTVCSCTDPEIIHQSVQDADLPVVSTLLRKSTPLMYHQGSCHAVSSSACIRSWASGRQST
eukprot:s106_g13.t1